MALATWLKGNGHDVDHVADIGLLSATDHEIWAAALARDAVLVTRDRDFAEWSIARAPGPQVLWVRIGNTANLSLIARLEVAWDQIQESLIQGARVVEAGRP
jgi:predicted nuclease of predicted toxin-antitoxin system